MNYRHLKKALADIPSELVEIEYSSKGWNCELSLAPEQLEAAAAILYREGFFIEAISGVDWLSKPKKPAKPATTEGETDKPEEQEEKEEDVFEIVYDFNLFAELYRVVLRCRVPRSAPSLPTISHIYPGADWHERETHDFFGIKFSGHPDLSPFILEEDADYHPLRKDYKP